MEKKMYLSILAAFATVAAIVLFFMLAAPLGKPFAWALIIGISTMPHYKRLLKRLKGHPGRSAGLMVLIVTICFVFPTTALVVSATMHADDWYSQAEQVFRSIHQAGFGSMKNWPLVEKGMALAQKYGFDVAGAGQKMAAATSGFLLNLAGQVAMNLFDFLLTLAIALFILFFIYRDGERVVHNGIVRLAPDREKGERYVEEVASITRAVTVGALLTCAVQGVTAGVGYVVAGVPAPIFFGAITAIAALIPVVGTTVVWGPLVALLAINGDYVYSIGLGIWCILFVGAADNAIRPLAVGAARDIPVLAIVLGAICGVTVLGVLGLILGPVIFAVLMSLWGEAVGDVEAVKEAAREESPHG